MARCEESFVIWHQRSRRTLYRPATAAINNPMAACDASSGDSLSDGCAEGKGLRMHIIITTCSGGDTVIGWTLRCACRVTALLAELPPTPPSWFEAPHSYVTASIPPWKVIADWIKCARNTSLMARAVIVRMHILGSWLYGKSRFGSIPFSSRRSRKYLMCVVAVSWPFEIKMTNVPPRQVGDSLPL